MTRTCSVLSNISENKKSFFVVNISLSKKKMIFMLSFNLKIYFLVSFEHWATGNTLYKWYKKRFDKLLSKNLRT